MRPSSRANSGCGHGDLCRVAVGGLRAKLCVRSSSWEANTYNLHHVEPLPVPETSQFGNTPARVRQVSRTTTRLTVPHPQVVIATPTWLHVGPR